MSDHGSSGMTRDGFGHTRASKPHVSGLPQGIDETKNDVEPFNSQIDCTGNQSDPTCELAKAEEEEREIGANGT